MNLSVHFTGREKGCRDDHNLTTAALPLSLLETAALLLENLRRPRCKELFILNHN
jgi:hypothetical protein